MTEENQETKEFIRDAILDTEEMKKMFVGGIAMDSKEEDIKSFFEDISGGEVTVQTINRKDEKEKKSHFCFVTLSSSEAVDEVLLKKKDLVFNGRKLDINRAVPKNNVTPGAHDKTKKLFIANLPKFNCSEEDLKKYFEDRHQPKYGTIESVQLIKKKDDAGNKTEENKGYGFVLVSTEDMADKMAIQHATFEFGGRRVELKKSVPTTESKGKNITSCLHCHIKGYLARNQFCHIIVFDLTKKMFVRYLDFCLRVIPHQMLQLLALYFWKY